MLKRFGFSEPSSELQNGETSIHRTTMDVFVLSTAVSPF